MPLAYRGQMFRAPHAQRHPMTGAGETGGKRRTPCARSHNGYRVHGQIASRCGRGWSGDGAHHPVQRLKFAVCVEQFGAIQAQRLAHFPSEAQIDTAGLFAK